MIMSWMDKNNMKNLNYAVIGNGRSAALVSDKGAIEWACLPEFDSASVFAKILDRNRGGSFEILVDDSYQIHQKYIRNTNIVITEFASEEGKFEVIDFMPRYKREFHRYVYPPDIIRYIRRISGYPRFSVRYDPRLMYSQFETEHKIIHNYIESYTINGVYESVYLYSDLPLEKILSGETMTAMDKHFFLLSYNQKLLDWSTERVYVEFQRTKVYWLNWVSHIHTFKKYDDEIKRSALVLKLLSYQRSGAILAAITTSLPETIGEVRNWDYRFSWVRDASMIITTLISIGLETAAEKFLKFIIDVFIYKGDEIQIMYGIRGERDLVEKELPWLEGYESSVPVRVGNAAYIQKQHDIYGVLLDVIYKYFELFKNTLENSEELWSLTTGVLRKVEKHWQEPDMGIWEFRSGKQHFVFSKVLCWVAFDRGVKIAQLLGRTEFIDPWSNLRDAVHNEIMENGWNEELQSFTQAYRNDNMDSANLLLASYDFVSPGDPMYVGTVMKIYEELNRDGLMYRYKNKDDFGEPRSSFTVCSFWMVKSLYQIGRKKEARAMFKNLLAHSNHVGLYSEDIDFKTKRLLGNFPQGYSHLALIDAAITLADMELDEEDELLSNLESHSRVPITGEYYE